MERDTGLKTCIELFVRKWLNRVTVRCRILRLLKRVHEYIGTLRRRILWMKANKTRLLFVVAFMKWYSGNRVNPPVFPVF